MRGAVTGARNLLDAARRVSIEAAGHGGHSRDVPLSPPTPRTVHLVVDGEPVDFDTSEETLARALRREGLGHVLLGCRDGRCGSCRLLLDGDLVNSCVVLVADVVDGATVETADALYDDEAGSAVIRAFDAERSTRCRLCVGALRVTAVSLVRRGELQDQEAREAACEKAACMCTGRASWRRALEVAAGSTEKANAAPSEEDAAPGRRRS